jgi:hypothetical protein
LVPQALVKTAQVAISRTPRIRVAMTQPFPIDVTRRTTRLSVRPTQGWHTDAEYRRPHRRHRRRWRE